MESKLPNCQPRTSRLWLAALVLALSWCGLSSAHAAPTTPSKAHQLQTGVPWSSTIDRVSGEYWGMAWHRLPEPLNPGDKVTFASDADDGLTFCLAPSVDDFGATDAARECDNNYGPGQVFLKSGKWRRTLKWTRPSSHGFLLVGTSSFDPVVYSVLLERIDRYTPDFTAPAVQVLDRRVKLNRRRAIKLRLVCPADEASPPCRGSALVTTRGKVRVGKTRRMLTLGRATFSLGANETGTITLRLNPQRVKLLLKGRQSVRTQLTVRVRDTAGNNGAQGITLRLVRP